MLEPHVALMGQLLEDCTAPDVSYADVCHAFTREMSTTGVNAAIYVAVDKVYTRSFICLIMTDH